MAASNSREDFGEVDRADAPSAAAEATADVHEAARVGGNDAVGAGPLDEGHLVGDHRSTDAGIADRERAAEAAALVEALERDQLQLTDMAQQPERLVGDAEAAEMAGHVIRRPGRVAGADVFLSQDADQELGELVESAG